MRVRVSRVDPSLPLPDYATPGSVAFDFICREDTMIGPRSLGLVPGNVIVQVPEGHALVVALRSSTPRRTGLVSPHGIGIVDQDFCGPEDEVQIQVYNSGGQIVTVHRGDRIAQGFVVPVARVVWEETDLLQQASRGGFGSTGP